ncbi:MAG: SPOR domain-containing protein [Bacteroidia bacterium]|nr:SPOR domain-containing protein [Bacteroidia bacterium]MDW8346885.1 SPOR domain-containing protein [Bacteroidia bacterium]
MIPAKLIAEYFYEFKKVSFQGIGTLERKHIPAKVDMADKVLVPPKVYIEFSKEVSNTNEFIRYLCVTQNITEKEAQLKVEQFVTQLKTILESKQEYVLDKLGKFKYNPKSQEITFEQSPDAFEDNPFYFGLGEAHFLPTTNSTLKPAEKSKQQNLHTDIQKVGSNFKKDNTQVSKITAQELKKSLEAIEKEENKKQTPQSKKRVFILSIATTIFTFFITLVFGLSYFFPSLDVLHVYHHKKRDTVHIQKKTVLSDTIQHIVQESTTLQHKTDEVKSDTHSTHNAPTHSSIVNEASSQTRGSYYIVVASFTSVDLAQQHLEKWKSKGFNANLLTSPQNNRYRLSISQCDNEQEALNRLSELKSKTGKSDLWILYQ